MERLTAPGALPRVEGTIGLMDGHDAEAARRWARLLNAYREPSLARSLGELALTLGPFLLIWVLALAALDAAPWLSAALSIPIAAFLVRLFLIQHDCGHGSFFCSRRLSDWVGRGLGVLTLTPYDVWKRYHALHHAAAGNLDDRGMGDVETLTVREYRALAPLGRLRYRLYRHPLVLFGLGPAYVFLLQYRLPLGLERAGARFWISAMGTNLALALWIAAMIWFGGLGPVLLIFLPSTLLAASIGVWLFYVQHQFELTSWDTEPDWQLHDAALHGSSHYVLPGVLRWLTADVGVHHVHHLQSRVPFYRLQEVLRDHPRLGEVQRLTIRDSLRCVKLKLWDEDRRQLVSFAEAGVN